MSAEALGQGVVVSQTDKLRIEMDVNGDHGVVCPTGALDEDVNLGVILDSMSQLGTKLKSIVFDLGHVERINSSGVREWLILLERLPKEIECSFSNVNQLFIEQASIVPGILGQRGEKLISFQGPYYCEQCKKEHSMLLEPAQIEIRDEQFAAPALKCPDCSSPLEFDWVEEEYFAFLKNPANAARNNNRA